MAENINLKVPETIFEWITQSSKQDPATSNVIVPVFMSAFASAKGTEKPGYYTKENFYKQFGTDTNFEKYGQAFLQTERIVRAGGKVFCKRVVAEDSTLANIAILAHVKSVKVQKTDAEGNLLYTDAMTQEETTVAAGNTPIYLAAPGCQIKYTAQSFTDIKSLEEAVENAKALYEVSNSAMLDGETETEYSVYPLFVLTDTGRGASIKRFRITPNYTSNKYNKYLTYTFEVIENSTITETLNFALHPDTLASGENISIQNVIRTYSSQLQCQMFDRYISEFIERVADLSGNTVDYVTTNDLLFGKERVVYTKNMTNIYIVPVDGEGESSYNLSYQFGNDLKNGTNGAFGNYPVETEAYGDELENFFDGTYTSSIYDLDNHKIDVILDANYPVKVKLAIEKLAAFREDLMAFIDMGVSIKTIQQGSDFLLENEHLHDKTVYYNILSYDIYHPYNKKQVRVTYTYSFATLLVDHFNNGRIRPLAGKRYNISIPEAIEGTVNIVPITTPGSKEKEILIDNHINYGAYYDGTLVIETQYTSRQENDELSFVNNVLGCQEIVKAVRTKCPLIRYGFLEGQENLVKYQEDVQSVLDTKSGNFASLKMEYLADESMVQNKVFYAAIAVSFRGFVQKEYFKLITL